MRNKLKIITLFIISIILTGCGNEYKGFWCNYDETSTIVVLLSKDYKEKYKKAVEAKIEEFENVETWAFYTKEDYAEGMGQDPNEMNIHDTFVITFESMDHIGTYIEELAKLKGVNKAEQSNAKTNLAIYSLESWGKYTFTNSDETSKKDLETGKYKMKNGVITFTPENKKKATRMLYTKDGYLCGDANCKRIFARSNATCTTE